MHDRTRPWVNGERLRGAGAGHSKDQREGKTGAHDSQGGEWRASLHTLRHPHPFSSSDPLLAPQVTPPTRLCLEAGGVFPLRGLILPFRASSPRIRWPALGRAKLRPIPASAQTKVAWVGNAEGCRRNERSDAVRDQPERAGSTAAHAICVHPDRTEFLNVSHPLCRHARGGDLSRLSGCRYRRRRVRRSPSAV